MAVRAERIEGVSEGFGREMGGTETRGADGVVEQQWWEGLTLDEADAARAWRATATAGGKVAAHYARAEGGTRWLRLQAKGGAAGDAEPWVLAVEDVTAEREESERARLEAEHFHALIQRSSEGISLFDRTSKILYESPSNKRIHGYDPEEMEGLTLISFCHGDRHGVRARDGGAARRRPHGRERGRAREHVHLHAAAGLRASRSGRH